MNSLLRKLFHQSSDLNELEAELLAGLKRGDQKSVRAWYARYQQKLESYFLAKFERLEDAQELTHDTFLSCLKHLPLFRGDSSLWTWMMSVAKHEVADFYRKKYAKKALHYLPLSDLLPAKVDDAHDLAQKVQLALRALTAEQQELLLQKYVDRKSVKDLAIELQRSVKAIESDLFRARQAFRMSYAQAGG
jgi:RNA polymerase sigma-70 factor, ECF subfamily